MHHGIKGQHWGERNGPPYPLKDSVKSRVYGANKLPRDSGSDINPSKSRYNCKECAEAFVKRQLGVDPNAVAVSDSERQSGNLSDFVANRNYNKEGVTIIGGDLGISMECNNKCERVTKAIISRFKDGDCGMVEISWDFDKKFKGYYSEKIIANMKEKADNGLIPDGHTFNFRVDGDKVIFSDDQKEIRTEDASNYFEYARNDKNATVVRLTKKAFAN